ncbi:MAG TPA: hypothetical protein DEB06_06930 [Phycisphaerales bacterium]|nr:hypothetical protein [Phycisphaerales bacterium]
MRTRRVTGFTLVEILIVVVILGILAAIVIPQFTSASQEAIKGALSSQLQTISGQVELYRVRNAGALPNADADPVVGGGNEDGWGVLVSGNYLKERPFNGFSGAASVTIGTEADQFGAGAKPAPADGGWIFVVDAADPTLDGIVFAVGFDGVNLSTEANYDETATIGDAAAPPAP